MAGLTSALIMGATTLGGAAIASSSQRRATSAATQQNDASNALLQQQYNQSRQDLTPWRISGQAALGEINRRLGLTGQAGQITGGSQFGGLTSGTTGQTQDLMYNPTTQTVNPTTGQVTGAGGAPIGSGGNLQRRFELMGGGNVLADSPQMAASGGKGGVLGIPAIPDAGNPQVNGGLGGGVVDPTAPMTNGPAPTTPVSQGPNTSDPRYGGFYASPGYQFRMDEGNRAITGNRAASGMLQSGDTLRALSRYGQDYASNEFNTQLNQLFNVAGLGQTATGQGNALGANYAANVGNNNINQGNVLASSYANQGNIWQNALGNLGGYAAYQWGNNSGQANPYNSSRPGWTMGGF